MNSTRNFPRTTSTPRQRSQGQIDFLTDLLTQIAEYDVERGRQLWFELRAQDQAGQLTAAKASDTISALKDERNEHRLGQQVDPREDRAPRPKLPEVPDGRYAVDNKDGETAFYRVRVSKTGYVTVVVMASDEERELPFVVARSVLRKIESDGVLEATARYGKEIGECGLCGRTLTDEVSRAAGIGPVCASRM